MRNTLIGSILTTVLGLSVLPQAYAQEVVYLIRHSEQMIDVEDPPLTQAGIERAKGWAGVFKNANLGAIYVTKKNRTQQTGEQISSTLNVPMEAISRKDVKGLVGKLRTEHADDAVLVISHTRAIPKVLKELGYSGNGEIDRKNYDDLFVIVPKTGGEPAVMRLRYP